MTGPTPPATWEPMMLWQKVIYGDTEQARAALAFYRERGWQVDDQHVSGREVIESRIYAFMHGWEAARSVTS